MFVKLMVSARTQRGGSRGIDILWVWAVGEHDGDLGAWHLDRTADRWCEGSYPSEEEISRTGAWGGGLLLGEDVGGEGGPRGAWGGIFREGGGKEHVAGRARSCPAPD